MEDFKKKCEFQNIPIVMEKKPEFEDESETPVEWFARILLKRTPKFLEAPNGKPIVINGMQTYLVNSSILGEFEKDVKSKYSLSSPGVYKRVA